MALSTHDALLHIMLLAAFSDTAASDIELGEIEEIIGHWPVFAGFDSGRLAEVATGWEARLNGSDGLEGVLEGAVEALPKRLHDTAYALAVDIAVADLELGQEELRLLEMLRDRLDLDRLVTAAIEAAARARHKRLEPPQPQAQ